jgi:hypothetical protein
MQTSASNEDDSSAQASTQSFTACFVCPFCPNTSVAVYHGRKQLIKHIGSAFGHPPVGSCPPDLELETVDAEKKMHDSRVKWVRRSSLDDMLILPKLVSNAISYRC